MGKMQPADRQAKQKAESRKLKWKGLAPWNSTPKAAAQAQRGYSSGRARFLLSAFCFLVFHHFSFCFT